MLELGERASEDTEEDSEDSFVSHHRVSGGTGLKCGDFGQAPGYIKWPWSGGENNFFLSHHTLRHRHLRRIKTKYTSDSATRTR